MTPLLDHILNYVLSDTEPGDTARARAGRSIADSLGVMLAGARSEIAPPLLAYTQPFTGDVPLMGAGRQASGEAAALVNASFGHAFDFDDGFPGYPVHVSNIVTACLISASAGRRISGSDFVAAFIRGVETAIAIGRRTGLRHYERGFHATGTIGVFAGIAAGAALVRREAATVRDAFGIGASLASGLQRNFGTMTKPLHAGWAARNAIVALDLAQAGMHAHHDALEGADGFIAAFGEAGDPTVSTAPLGFDAIASIGLGLKKFPCVNACHRPIDGLLTLRARHGLSAENTARITCLVPPGSLRPIKYADPQTPHEAKFSITYILSAALVDGAIDLGSFTDEAIARAGVRELFARIAAREDASCAGDAGDTRGPGTRGRVVVQVETTAGTTHAIEVAYAPGNPRREMTRADLAEKLIGCATYAGLTPVRAAELTEHILDLSYASDVGDIITMLGAVGTSVPTAS